MAFEINTFTFKKNTAGVWFLRKVISAIYGTNHVTK